MTDTREPRVFRAGDTEPDDVLEVRHSNSQRFQRCDEVHFKAGVEVDRNHTWTAGDGDPLDWHELTSRLRGYTLTEVLLADPEQESELERLRAEQDARINRYIESYQELAAERDQLQARVDEMRPDSRYLRYCDWPDCLRAYDVRTGPKPEVDGHPWIHVRAAHALLCPSHQDAGHRPQRFAWKPGDTTISTSCECGERSGDLSPTTTERCYEWWADHVRADAPTEPAPGLQCALDAPSPVAPLPGDETPQPEEDQHG